MKKALLVIVGVILFFVFIGSLSDDKPEPKAITETKTEEPVLTAEEIKANKKYEEKAKLEIRKSYETALRNSYLDNNLDIKVDVKGKNKDVLELQFALFNDVWLRKMETSGNLDEWHKMGFKKIVVTDGYDYNQAVTWKD